MTRVIHADGDLAGVCRGEDGLTHGRPLLRRDGLLDDLVARPLLALQAAVQALQQSAVHKQPLQGTSEVRQVVQGSVRWCKGPSDGARVRQMVQESVRWCKSPSDGARVRQVVQESVRWCNSPSDGAIVRQVVQ